MRSAALLVAGLGALFAGCEPGSFCGQCHEPPAKPATKIDWNGLSEELAHLDLGKDVTIKIENAEVVLELGDNAWKVQVTNWDELAAKLREIEKVNAAEAKHFALVHRVYAMLAEREAPNVYHFWLWGDPPSDMCPSGRRALVFFPHEAQVGAWVKGDYDPQCAATSQSSTPVCPNYDLYEEYIGQLFDSLKNCADEVTLRVRGFASSSDLGAPTEREKERLWGEFTIRSPCNGEAIPDECRTPPETDDGYSRIFNVLVAEERARNIKEILSAGLGDRLRVVTPSWVSYEDMEKARSVVDEVDGVYDGFEGMLNRRVEIEVVP